LARKGNFDGLHKQSPYLSRNRIAKKGDLMDYISDDRVCPGIKLPKKEI
jgi:hypothetical protein